MYIVKHVNVTGFPLSLKAVRSNPGKMTFHTAEIESYSQGSTIINCKITEESPSLNVNYESYH